MQLCPHELHYNLGCILHEQGDLNGALVSYRQAIALNPQYAKALHNLGVVLDEQGQLFDAIEVYRQAIALQPNYVSAYSKLGYALLRQGNYQDAAQIYRQAIALQPDGAMLHHDLGQALLLRSPAEAIAAFQHAITLNPELVIAHYSLGRALQAQGQLVEAIECFRHTVHLDPSHGLAYSDWGEALIAQGHWAAAMDCFWQAIVLQPEFVSTYCQRWLAANLGTDEWSMARRACAQFLQALQNQTPAPDVLVPLAETYLHLGNVLTDYGGLRQYQQAERFYYRTLALQPDSLDGYLRLGHCLARQQNWNAAVLIYHMALSLQPDQPQVYLQLGQVLEKQQQLEQAIACYRRALRLSDNEQDENQDKLARWNGGTREAALGSAAIAEAPNPRTQPTVESGWTPLPATARPQGVYRTTWEWMHAVGMDASHYQQVTLEAAEELTDFSLPLKLPLKLPSVLEAPLEAPQTCEGLNCGPCLKQLFSQFKLTHVGQGAYLCSSPAIPSTGALPTFVAHLPNGRVWAVPQQSNWQICNAIATLSADDYLLADLSREYPGQLPGCRQPAPSQHRILVQDELPPLTSVEGTVAALVGLSGHVYFHWMVDVLPRLELLRRSGMAWEQFDYFLINSPQQRFQQETLRALGVPLEKVLSSDRYPHLQASHLVVPSFAGELGWMRPWVLQFLRHYFLPLAANAQMLSGMERIYISRANASYRTVLNEEEVMNYLQDLGFVSVVLESLSLAEQVAVFRRARVIVAAHGSGLTNLAFCNSETTVIELVSPHYVRHYYWVISQQLGLTHYYLLGERFSCYPIRQLMYQNPLTEDILINLSSLKALMTTAGLAG